MLLPLGLTLVLACASSTALRAQDHTYSDGEDDSNTLDATGNITLTVPSGAATQSGTIINLGNVTVNPTSSDLGTLTLTTWNTYYGDTTIHFGTLAVAGSTALLGSNSTTTYVGYADGDQAALQISAGGQIYDLIDDIGHDKGSVGTATVTGANSLWYNSSFFNVGNSGSGTLTVSDGGSVQSGYTLSLGKTVDGTGSMTVDGAGSTLSCSSQALVGDGGTGTLTISNGGQVSDAYGYIGNGTGSSGAATITGTGSTWSHLFGF